MPQSSRSRSQNSTSPPPSARGVTRSRSPYTSAPTPFVRYMQESDRPQARLDRDFERGMGVSVGRLREDPIFDYRFVCLSHNTLRGAAGGGVLSAELLCATDEIIRK